MTSEKRRLRLAQRQALLAQVSQRAAMRSVADALSEETRSATLAERSRELVRVYGGRSQAADGAGLAQTGSFAVALGALAQDAEKGRADASEQTAWQMEALGKAQDRARRQSDRLESAKAQYRAARERRLAANAPPPAKAGLARKVHRPDETETSLRSEPPKRTTQ